MSPELPEFQILFPGDYKVLPVNNPFEYSLNFF